MSCGSTRTKQIPNLFYRGEYYEEKFFSSIVIINNNANDPGHGFTAQCGCSPGVRAIRRRYLDRLRRRRTVYLQSLDRRWRPVQPGWHE